IVDCLLVLRITTSLLHRQIALVFFSVTLRPPKYTLFPYTTLFRSQPQLSVVEEQVPAVGVRVADQIVRVLRDWGVDTIFGGRARSEEHTSELQSRGQLVCRLLHEKNNALTGDQGCCSCYRTWSLLY